MERVRAKLTFISSTANPQPEIDVMFNPASYAIERTMKYAEVPVIGLPLPLLQFVRGEAEILKDLTLLLDNSDRKVLAAPSPGEIADDATSPLVHQRLEAMRRLVRLDSELHAPPVVRFTWSQTEFDGVVTAYKEEFLHFNPDGRVLRAKITLTLKRYRSAEQLYRDVTPLSPDRTKTRVVREGERLDAIAAEEYGDPALWPAIARANNLSRPRFVPAGTLLIIPPLD